MLATAPIGYVLKRSIATLSLKDSRRIVDMIGNRQAIIAFEL